MIDLLTLLDVILRESLEFARVARRYNEKSEEDNKRFINQQGEREFDL